MSSDEVAASADGGLCARLLRPAGSVTCTTMLPLARPVHQMPQDQIRPLVFAVGCRYFDRSDTSDAGILGSDHVEHCGGGQNPSVKVFKGKFFVGRVIALIRLTITRVKTVDSQLLCEKGKWRVR